MTIDDLISQLESLRLEWSNHWKGLPAVLTDCLSRLRHDDFCDHHSPRYLRLKRAAESMAERVEAVHAAMAEQKREAAYHNRLHFADTLCAITALMVASRPKASSLDQQHAGRAFRNEQEMLALLTMVVHDFQHDGRVNQAPMEMESISVNSADPIIGNFGVSDLDREWVARLVRRTDPGTIFENHQAVNELQFDLSDLRWMQAIINEADVLASALPNFGRSLAQALASEWSELRPEMARSVVSPAGRLYFLERLALFSTPGSALLGLQQLRDEQIRALRQAIA